MCLLEDTVLALFPVAYIVLCLYTYIVLCLYLDPTPRLTEVAIKNVKDHIERRGHKSGNQLVLDDRSVSLANSSYILGLAKN